VHLAVRLPLIHSIADLVRAYKSESSVVLSRSDATTAFRWQTGYGAFSFDPDNVEPVLRYVEAQRQHHQFGTVYAPWEQVARDDEPIG
jgi:REP element-mobilizing transposase RayT